MKIGNWKLKIISVLCIGLFVLPDIVDAKTVFITSAVSWTVPMDWTNSNLIEVIGGGGGGDSANNTGSGGGGGSAYAQITNLSTLTRGGSVTIQVGQGGKAPQEKKAGR